MTRALCVCAAIAVAANRRPPRAWPRRHHERRMDSNGSAGRFAYLDAERLGGVAVELLWNRPR